MKVKSILAFLILILCISSASSAQELLPTSTTGQIVKHTYYTLSYCEKDEQPEWVYYELTSEMVKGRQPRTDDYRPDEKVSSVSAQLEDYSHSGYDRGHLCPAGDMKLNLTSMSESFYLSNMSPQEKEFNAGIWNTLVSIPKYFYKVIYDPRGQGRMIAFLIPNEDSEKPLQNYVVIVDSLERLTRIDFFPELPDSIENQLESSINLSSWSFNK